MPVIAGPCACRPSPREATRPLAPAGPPRHTRGMDPEREDYADPDPPAARVPVWLLELVPVIFVAVVAGLAVVLFIDYLVNGG